MNRLKLSGTMVGRAQRVEQRAAFWLAFGEPDQDFGIQQIRVLVRGERNVSLVMALRHGDALKVFGKLAALRCIFVEADRLVLDLEKENSDGKNEKEKVA